MEDKIVIKKSRALGPSIIPLLDKKTIKEPIDKDPIEVTIPNKEKLVNFKSFLVRPHTKVSKKVTVKDLPVLIEAAQILYNLCYTQIEWINGSYAMHHSQIEERKPLNFFVTADMKIVINPVIINHTKVPVERVEGCVSFPFNAPIKVKRFNKIEVKYKTLEAGGTMSKIIEEGLSGVDAQIWQHECQHGEGKFIYEIEDQGRDVA